jgi:hypothetical protein
LPVPGGPKSSTPFGIRAPSAWNFFGFSRNSLISWSSSTASSAPGDVAEGDLRRVDAHPLGPGLAERHDLRAAALDLVHQEDPEADEDDERQQVGQRREPAVRLLALDVVVEDLAVGLRRLQRVLQPALVVDEARLVLAVALAEGDLERVVLRLERDVLDLLALSCVTKSAYVGSGSPSSGR